MTKKNKAVGLIIGLSSLLVAVVGPMVLPPPPVGLSPAGYLLSAVAGAIVTVVALYPWKCMKCHGEGTVPELFINRQKRFVEVAIECDYCQGDGSEPVL